MKLCKDCKHSLSYEKCGLLRDRFADVNYYTGIVNKYEYEGCSIFRRFKKLSFGESFVKIETCGEEAKFFEPKPRLTYLERLKYAWENHGGSMVGVFIIFFMSFYYFLTWWRVTNA